MVKVFLGNSLWQLVVQADFISKTVLVFLLGMSVICWTIFFYKIILLRIKKQQIAAGKKAMMQVNNFEQLLSVSTELSETLPGYFLKKNLTFLKSMLVSPSGQQKTGLHPQEWELVQQNIDQNVDEMIQAEESYLPVLSTCAAVAPLLGLFGTVWGLVHAFIRISQQQSADIATVAPGIAEALITTLAGLVVAVPALIMFNVCATQVRMLDRQFLQIADQFSIIAQQLVIYHNVEKEKSSVSSSFSPDYQQPEIEG